VFMFHCVLHTEFFSFSFSFFDNSVETYLRSEIMLLLRCQNSGDIALIESHEGS